MRIDVVSIFPEYLAPPGTLAHRQGPPGRDPGTECPRPPDFHLRQAPDSGRHPLRRRCRHGHEARAVGPALESVAPDAQKKPVLIVPSPAGERFNQALAYELAEEERLVFACGRYEGIDERVIDWAHEHFTVRPVSLGDYVLNGGEVAVLAMVEAIGRLLPGVVGNPESLVEESHSDGLLEYPVYTKPSSWREHDVPDVLLSGNHGKIAQWRKHQQFRRTAERRPDLLAGFDASGLSRADRTALADLGYDVVDGRLSPRPGAVPDERS